MPNKKKIATPAKAKAKISTKPPRAKAATKRPKPAPVCEKAQTALTNDARLLLAANSMNSATDLFMGTFFVSFLMQNATSEIFSISLYNLFFYIAVALGFFFLADWVKRRNKVTVLRLVAIPKIIFLLAIIALGDRVVDFVIPMGILLGIIVSFYWAPMHCLVGEKVLPTAMAKFVGYRALINRLTKVVLPVVLGLFITVGSYVQVAKALLFVCLAEIILMAFIKPSEHRSKNKPDIAGFYRCMMRFRVIRKLFAIEALRGFTTGGPLGTVITIYTIHLFRTDLMLGMFTAIFAACSIITSFMFGKFGKKAMFPRILTVTTIAAVGSLSLFVFHTSEVTFLIYNFVFVTAIGLLDKIAEVNMYNMSKSPCVSKDHKTEYFVFRESALAIGRVSAFTALLAVGVFGSNEWLRWYLIPLTLAVVFIGWGSIKINQHLK